MDICAVSRVLSIIPVLLLIFNLSLAPNLPGKEVDGSVNPAQSAAAEDFFENSTLVGSTDSIREGETITFQLTIRYNGYEESMPISVVFPIPQPAMFVSASPAMVLPDESRELQWQGSIEKGRDFVFSITLITLPDSADNRTLISSAAISWRGRHDGPNWQGGVHWVQTETEIHSRLQPQELLILGGKTMSRTGATVFAYLIGGPLLIVLIPWLIRRRESSRRYHAKESAPAKNAEGLFLHALTFAFVVLIGVAHLVGYLLLEDYRRLYTYRQNECAVLDKTIAIDEVAARPGQIQSTSTRYNESMVAVRYTLDGKEITAAGPPEVTSMRSPLAKYALRQLADFEIGKAYPCWIDPRDPTVFYLIRGISWGWYLLCAGPLILLFFLARYLRRRMTG